MNDSAGIEPDAIDALIAYAVREADRRRYAASLSFWPRSRRAHHGAAAQWQDLADNAARQRGSGNAMPTGRALARDAERRFP